MNITCNNGVTVVGKTVYINGEKLPDVPSGSHCSNVTTIGDKVYINGYEYKDGKWKRTLAALWYYLF